MEFVCLAAPMEIGCLVRSNGDRVDSLAAPMERGHGGRLRLPLAEPILQLIREEDHERQEDHDKREPHKEFEYRVTIGILLFYHLDQIEDRPAPRDEQVERRKKWDDLCGHNAAGLQSIGI
jgi:hypothetical protein